MIWQHLSTIASLAAPIGLPVERLEGRLHESNMPIALTLAGAAATADFIAGALMTVERRIPVGRLPTPFALRSGVFDRLCADSDLVGLEVPPCWRSFLPANTPLRMPAWVSQEILAGDDSPLVVPTALRKEVMRHCRREGYEVDFSTDIDDFRRFYAELYRPYVTARFRAGAVLVDERRFLAVSRGMTLAILVIDHEWIAGMLFRLGKRLDLGWFGASSMPPRAGASEVLDTRVIEHAAAHGVRRVVMGHSRPSLADGVVRYKSRFGAVVRPTRFPQRIIGLRMQRPSPALTAAVNAAKFVIFRNGIPDIYQAPLSVPL